MPAIASMFSRGEKILNKTIPKKIHYIWFGKGEKSALIKKCVENSRKYLEDLEIIE